MSSPAGTFLTAQEIQDLTGVKIRQLQFEWLASRGWPFEIDHFNRPVVLRSVLECKLGGTSSTQDGFTLDEANVA